MKPVEKRQGPKQGKAAVQDGGNSESKDSQTKILNYATSCSDDCEESDISPIDLEEESSAGKQEIAYFVDNWKCQLLTVTIKFTLTVNSRAGEGAKVRFINIVCITKLFITIYFQIPDQVTIKKSWKGIIVRYVKK